MADDDSRAGKSYATERALEVVNKTHVPHDAGLAQAFAVPEGIPAIQVSPSDGQLLHLLLQQVDLGLRLAGGRDVAEHHSRRVGGPQAAPDWRLGLVTRLLAIGARSGAGAREHDRQHDSCD